MRADPITIDRLWLAAIGSAARGHYASARRDLALAERIAGGRARDAAHGVRLARVFVAAASIARQLGDHRAGARYDGRAAVLVAAARSGTEGSGTPAGIGVAEALWIDAIAGAAADALGDGGIARAAGIARRLDALTPAPARDRTEAANDVWDTAAGAPPADGWEVTASALCASEVPARGPSGRELVRAGWVRAEIAMTAGDGGAAVAAATGALDRASIGGSCRHRIKSALVLAAARVVAGEPDGARPLVEAVRAAADDHGHLPLLWAAGMLAPAVGLDAPEGPAVTAELGRRGGLPTVLGARSFAR
ncbi:hypothetical protein [Millisia brevis]|uniref:hypothetical protein n=1 Tax=Millisia brevis TaxID=264148 RepID=UPI0012EDAF8D|nr:hypothetical protein [Millisia brevis]